MNWLLFLLPFLAALVGWLIQRLLLRLLFHPANPRKIMGITIQGIFPAKQASIAAGVASIAAGQFESLDIERRISDPKTIGKIMPVIEKHIDEFLRVKLGNEMPFIKPFIGDKTVDSLKKIFMKELGTLFPEVMKNYAGNLKKDLNIENTIREKIVALESANVETAIKQHLAKEIKYLELAGVLTGFLIGVIQLLLTLVVL